MTTYIFVGANSDIAKKTIELLGDEAQLILLTRDKTKLPEDVQQRFQCMDCNPCELDDVVPCFQSICNEHNVSGVVNFCGSILLKSASMLTAADWKTTMDINLTTAFNVAHATTKYVKENCSMVFLSTAAAHIGLPNHEAIAAAKAGVEGLARSVSASYAKKNIRANVIAPGLIETHLSQAITKTERTREFSLSMHGLNRLGKPQDIASMITWLLDDTNNWMTGETIRIDGGLSTLKVMA